MDNSIVTQDNALINSSYTLNLIEKRIVVLAIMKSRQTGKGITTDDFLEIYAKDYEESFSVGRQASYMALKSACEDLFNRYFTYDQLNDKGGNIKYKSRWVSHIGYDDDYAKIKIIFSPSVVGLIHDLESRFTSYFLSDIRNITSAYSIRLYELIIAWKSVGETPIFELKDIKQKLGVPSGSYERMFDFKKNVLDIGINQINEHSNIYVTGIQHKKGRTISGFSFVFKVIDEKSKLKKINKKQAESMAKVGETYKELYSRLSKEYLIC